MSSVSCKRKVSCLLDESRLELKDEPQNRPIHEETSWISDAHAKIQALFSQNYVGTGIEFGNGLLRICLQLDLTHPRVQKVKVALDVAKQLWLIGRLRVVVLAVLKVHRDWSCKADFFQVGKECLEINHALAQRT